MTRPQDAHHPGADTTPGYPRSRTVARYGFWPSPVAAELVAHQATAYDAVHMAGEAIYWLETRPAEGGRTAVVRWTPDHERSDAVPPGFHVGSRVHEYGGGAYLPTDIGGRAGHTLFVSCLDDDRLYRLDPGREPRPITPPPAASGALRYADLRLTPDGRWLVCVRERHDPDGGQEATVNELVALPADGSAPPQTLAGGHDFYAAPRPSPDGRTLAWVTWDRPRMPWDGSDLWVADLSPDGQLGPVRHVAGGPAESIVQPEWTADGGLLFVSDRTGWWNLHRYHPELAASHDPAGHIEPLLPLNAEFADAPWELDYSSYAPLADGRIACRYRRDGVDHLAVLHPQRRHLEPLAPSSTFTSVKPYLRAAGDRLAFIAASPTTSPAVVTMELASGHAEVLAGGGCPIPDGYVTTPRQLIVPAADGPVHARYYPPANQDANGPPGRRPPLLVQAHPGPTADARVRLELRVQFFTSRGFAVLDVDYGGSTGYGRAYRERLTGRWGVVDVEDCMYAARHLASSGDIDPDRIAIVGASAGGYTALRALATNDLFAAGVSYFGIADLEAFRMQAPKFQAHQLDRLIGPYPDAIEAYRARSPVHLAGLIRRPVLLLQGAEDPVVPPTQTEAMVRALQRRRVPHRLLAFPGEGHGFRRQATIRQALEAELAFYQEMLRL